MRVNNLDVEYKGGKCFVTFTTCIGHKQVVAKGYGMSFNTAMEAAYQNAMRKANE